MMRRVSPNSQRGFTLIELVMVVAIILAIAAYAIPNVLSAISDYKLKGTMSQVAGLLQQQRMTAVRLNSVYSLRTAASGGRTIAWFELPSGNNQWDAGEPMVELSGNVTNPTSGFPASTTLYSAASISPQTPGTTIQFNARGLPCVGTTPCSIQDASNNPVAFVLYFQGTSNYGKPMWGAITVTPAGRIRSWFYNGSSYSPM